MFDKYIKMCGLPRTCTNIVEVNLRENFDVCVLINSPFWKHYYHGNENFSWKNIYIKDVDEETMQLNVVQHIEADDIEPLTCVKNPYTWLVSFFIAFGENEVSFSNFIRGYSKHYKEKINKEINPVKLYGELNRHFLSISKTFVRQEDWTMYPILEMKRLKKIFSLKQNDAMLGVCRTHMAAGLIRYNKQYEPPAALNIIDEDIEYINQNIDRELVINLGYNLI